MWTSSNSVPFPSPSNSYAILGNDSNSGNPRLPKSMEEIWKDITLSSLHHSSSSPSRGMILQDFFSTRDPPHSAVDVSPPPPPQPPPVPPPTMLTLNSALHPQDHHHHLVSPLSQPFNHIPGGGNKRFPDMERSSGDRRHKRMIKNRESAARSRARKQAYTYELELEVSHLLEENAKLKKQQQQLRVAAAENHGCAKKNGLQRTSTAPF